MNVLSRAGPRAVALETTLLLHGIPKPDAPALAARLKDAVRVAGAQPVVVGVYAGTPTVGLTDAELTDLLAQPKVPKANTSNLGVLLHQGAHAATTVSTTLELAAAAGVRYFATGGLGGIHLNYSHRLDISADLSALARFPVAVITSGVKSLLDVDSSREALETLGIPVIGFRTDRFPAFYIRESDSTVDARFDDERELAAFVKSELARTNRAIVIANPIPMSEAIPSAEFSTLLQAARAKVDATPGTSGRDATPAILATLHDISRGRTLRANVALAIDNASLAGRLAAC